MSYSIIDWTKRHFVMLAVLACFILSGFAALLYQTAWLRQISVVYGTSELAVATVLAAYMGGLACGAMFAGKYLMKTKNPVLVYGILEAVIAISALLVPQFIKVAGLIYVTVFGGQPQPVDASGFGQAFFYMVVTFVVLLVPTAAMGATLPLLSKYAITNDTQVTGRVGILYASNTLGAIGGTLMTAFLFLPALGLLNTVFVGAALNLLVFIVAVVLNKLAPLSATEPTAVAAVNPKSKAKGKGDKVTTVQTESKIDLKIYGQHWVGPLILLSGATSFIYEVLWTRLLSHILGGSVYAFAVMLAGFLAGITLGSAIASVLVKTRRQAITGFALTQIGVALTAIAIYHSLEFLVTGVGGVRANWLLASSLLLPSTLLIGATFPLAVRIKADSAASAGGASAAIFAWNTVGAVTGAIIGGFFIIPYFEYQIALKLTVCLNLALALVTCLLISSESSPSNTSEKLGFKLLKMVLSSRAVMATSVFLLLGIGIFYVPPFQDTILRFSPFGSVAKGEILVSEVGRSSTVLLYQNNGKYYLRNNGLPESGVSSKHIAEVPHNQRFLSTLPALLNPQARSALIVGFGGGVVGEDLYPRLESIDILELEPEVIVANSLISEERQHDPLQDPRVKVYINDARNALQLTDKSYDFIVSQPSHPWTAGASHLFTLEFAELVSSNLADKGVFLQWMNVGFTDENLLRSQAATLRSVYRYVRVYCLTPRVLFFVASNQPFYDEIDWAKEGQHFPVFFQRKGIISIEDLIAGLVMDEQGLEEFIGWDGEAADPDLDLITDNYNRMAMESASIFETKMAMTIPQLFTLTKEYSPLYDPDSWIYTELLDRLHFHQVVVSAIKLYTFTAVKDLFDTIILAEKRVGGSQSPSRFLNALYPNLSPEDSDYRALKSSERFAEIVAEEPENSNARYLWLYHLFLEGNEDIKETVMRNRRQLPTAAYANLMAKIAKKNNDLEELGELSSDMALSKPLDLWNQDNQLILYQYYIDVGRASEEASDRFESGEKALEVMEEIMRYSANDQFWINRFLASSVVGNPEIILGAATDLYNFVFSALQSPGAKFNDSTIGLLIDNLRFSRRTLNSVLKQTNDSKVVAEAEKLLEREQSLYKRLVRRKVTN